MQYLKISPFFRASEFQSQNEKKSRCVYCLYFVAHSVRKWSDLKIQVKIPILYIVYWWYSWEDRCISIFCTIKRVCSFSGYTNDVIIPTFSSLKFWFCLIIFKFYFKILSRIQLFWFKQAVWRSVFNNCF
jgi:hypothetical protein